MNYFCTTFIKLLSYGIYILCMQDLFLPLIPLISHICCVLVQKKRNFEAIEAVIHTNYTRQPQLCMYILCMYILCMYILCMYSVHFYKPLRVFKLCVCICMGAMCVPWIEASQMGSHKRFSETIFADRRFILAMDCNFANLISKFEGNLLKPQKLFTSKIWHHTG